MNWLKGHVAAIRPFDYWTYRVKNTGGYPLNIKNTLYWSLRLSSESSKISLRNRLGEDNAEIAMFVEKLAGITP